MIDSGRRDVEFDAAALLELAGEALHRVARFGAAGEASALIDQLDSAGRRRLICAIACADPAGRVGLLNALAGAEVFGDRAAGGPALLVGKGERDAVRVHRRDGSRGGLELRGEGSPVSGWRRLGRWLGALFGRRRGPPAPRPLAAVIESALGDPDNTSVVVELAAARLPDDVVAVDVASAETAARLGIHLDGCLAIGGVDLAAGAFPGVIAVEVPHLLAVDGARPIAEIERALAELAWSRAARIAGRVLERVEAARAYLESNVAGAVAELDRRRAACESLRFPDPAGFVDAELAAGRATAIQVVQQLIHQLSNQLSSELGGLRDRWLGTLEAAATGDELRAAVTAVAAAVEPELAEVRGDLNRLLTAALRGTAHQLFTAAVANLPHRGLLDPATATAPALIAIDVAAALEADAAQLVPSTSRLEGLFRSIDSRRRRLVEELTAALERVERLARSELLDAEPALEAAMLESQRGALAAVAGSHAAALDARRGRELAAIAVDRAELAPTIELRDRVSGDERRLALAVGPRHPRP